MKKFLSISYLLLIFIFFAFFTGCVNDSDKPFSLLNFAPSDSSILINANSFESLALAVEQNDLLDEVSNYNQLKELKQQLKILKQLKIDSEFLICLSQPNTDSLNFTIITKARKGLINLDSLSSDSTETISSNHESIIKSTISGQPFFSKIIDSVFIGSNSMALLQQSNSITMMDPELETLYTTSSREKSFSMILNLTNERLKPHFFNDSLLNTKPFTNYILVDADISQDNLTFNGITKATDSINSLINVFNNTIPHENEIAKIAPNDVDYMASYSYNNFKTIYENLQKFNKKDSLIASPVFDNSVEIGLIYLNNQKAVIINSIDASLAQETMDYQDIKETFRDIPIYIYSKPEIFKKTFSPLINLESASEYIVLDDFFVFSESTDFLKDIISNYQNKNTLYESNVFKNLMQDLSDASSIFIYNNASALNETLNSNFDETMNLKLDSYKASAIQFIYDYNFAHVNAAFKTYKSRGAANSVTEDLDFSLDAELISDPQLITNHTNNQKDIVVQDINNNLYLISNQGKLFWKKQLEGKVLGKIEQMDIYKNGRLQLVFATPHRVYVLDRNGKDVGPFPLKFNDEITQPLSLFDYDNNKNYRLLVTQGNSLLMYDRNGNSVKGFKVTKDNNKILSQPKHFRIGRKDYIVFSQGNKMKILDRTGRDRINVKENINFSKNEIYLYNNNFITSNTNGDLIQVNEKGQTSKLNLNLNTENYITSTTKTLVTLSENRLNIKSRLVELDYGDYTAPQIYYINDKIYVTTTDLQAKKIYLFDSLGKPVANFPIYGNSSIVVNNIDKDKNLEVITKGDDNSVIVYEIN